MRASIIIPSYNARERLYLNLTALNRQSYERDDVEVIVVDNGSDDNTFEMARNFRLKYPLKVIRIEENKGIAFGRNKGVLSAEGDILIFHDSDMIAMPDYIKLHLEAHREPNVVACGMFWRRIFTYYYENFTAEQLSNFEKLRKLRRLYRNCSYKDKAPLISEEQTKTEDLQNYSFDLEMGFICDLMDIRRQYGNNFEGYYLPWRFFITNNLSAEREKVLGVGMFDTNIVRYGYEDYDLGIRLYKSGCKFTLADHIVSLHQEHPANYRSNDLVENINYICSKYNSIYFIDLVLVCLSDSLNIDKTMMNGIAWDILRIIPKPEYHEILELFLELLQVLRKRFFKPQEEDGKAVYARVNGEKEYYIQKIIRLQRQEWVPYFVPMLSILFKLAINMDFERLVKISQDGKGELL